MSKQSATPKTVNEVIDIINNSPASMFTKSDVIALVKSIEVNNERTIDVRYSSAGRRSECKIK